MKKNSVVKVHVKSFANNELFEDLDKVIVVGRGYFLKGLDESFLSHGVGDEFTVELKSSEAYGPRQRDLLRMIPFKYFVSNNVRPVKGLMLNIDGLLGKVVSVSPGRVLVDFNHPLAGKDLRFEVKVISEVNDLADKARAVVKSFLNQDVNVSVKDGVLELSNIDSSLPESIKDKLSLELNEVLGGSIKNIKYLSKK